MISQLITKLSNTTKSEKYQQEITKNYRLIAARLNKQNGLGANSRAIQQIIFTGKIKATEADTRAIIYYILEKSKETMLQFSKGTTSFVATYKWLNMVKQMLNYQILNSKN